MRALLLLVLLSSCGPGKPRTVDASVVFANKLTNEGVEGRIHCGSTRPNEIACSVSQQGEVSVTVCFHVEITCQNGNRTTAESCRETAPGTEVRTLHSAEGCDAIDAGRVTDAWIVKQ